MKSTVEFPKEFLWGAATSAYQIEGSYGVDGMGPSVWGTFVNQRNAIFDGHTGSDACDHYHRYREDVALMREIGLRCYRMSVAWPRVLPEGIGQQNRTGLDFYERLVDNLLENNIRPFVTLFHWDYPESLQQRGGWLNPESPRWFAEYAGLLARTLGDRVKDWMTFNEPQVFLGIGHRQGLHAPGLKLEFHDILRAGHNVLLAHGQAVAALRANSNGPCRIGYAPACVPAVPLTDSPADVQMARQETFRSKAESCWSNSWWSDPVFLGSYPEEGLISFADKLPTIGANDMATICQPLDFLGLNIYQGTRVRADEGGCEEVRLRPSQPRNALNWPIVPEVLRWGPKFCYERYKVPILITENGVTYRDSVALDGKVHDPNRIDFISRHLLELRRAIQEGVNVQGYMYWSLLDNFEWAEGYKERFGLVYVDYDTQERILKDSAHWYRSVITHNGGNISLQSAGAALEAIVPHAMP